MGSINDCAMKKYWEGKVLSPGIQNAWY